jgi:hypothetical protein
VTLHIHLFYCSFEDTVSLFPSLLFTLLSIPFHILAELCTHSHKGKLQFLVRRIQGNITQENLSWRNSAFHAIVTIISHVTSALASL